MSFNTTDNKKLIWSLLLESSYFKGFPASQKDMVKRVLDGVINELSQNPNIQSLDIIDKNKEVVKQMVMYRDLWVQDGTINNSNSNRINSSINEPSRIQYQPQNYQQPQNMNMNTNVTAEDLREQRSKEFNDTFNRKQAEMDKYLNVAKPSNIDFSDSAREERIGGDMERLVAEAEERRKQQMDIFLNGNGGQTKKEAENWINGGRPLKIDNDSTLPIDAQSLSPQRRQQSQQRQRPQTQPSQQRRKVHFNDDQQTNLSLAISSNDNNINNINNENNEDNDIFSKLKRKTVDYKEQQINQSNELKEVKETNGLLLKRLDMLETTVLNMQKELKQIILLMTKNNETTNVENTNVENTNIENTNIENTNVENTNDEVSES